MPVYEYACLECGKEFTLLLSVVDRDRKAVRCPDCKSDRIEQLVTTCEVVTGRKS
jgi:putative FmdB family regulatory protein